MARTSDTLTLSELLGALSCALDMTEGQPAGHSMRCCWIGAAIGREIGLPEPELYDLYYTLLLKDLGCSSNASKVADFYRTDDRAFKQRFKTIGPKLTDSIGFLLGNAASELDPIRRAQALAHVFKHAGATSRELIATRCHQGATIALRLGFSDAVAGGVRDLDEHWDGGGAPEGKAGEAISLYARIALLAQAVDVFHAEAGPAAALTEARRRRGGWFDPALVDALGRAAKRSGFWTGLTAPDLSERLLALEPATQTVALDDARLDAIAEGFGLVVDAKSPFTAGHSGRVADYAVALGDALGLDTARRPWLRRAALLHDIGKLGVSNRLLDKPGPLSDEEWDLMRAHADKTREILGRVAAFDEWAAVAAAHHEKLDGTGYPLRLSGQAISLETRIITACDVFDALTADRPYRSAMPVGRAFEIMRAEVGRGVDADVLAALERLAEKRVVLAA